MTAATVIFLCVSIIASASTEMVKLRDEAETASEQCEKQFSITKEHRNHMHQKGVVMNESDESARCYIECMMKSVGQQVDEDGKFDAAAVKRNILKYSIYFDPQSNIIPNQERIDSLVSECATIDAGPAKCLTNYKIWTCLYAKFHDL